MGESIISRNLSIDEYLAFEEKAEVRHEYHRGEIFAMAGGTPTHSLLTMNVGTALNLAGRPRGCSSYSGDMRIRIDAENRFLYPDVSLVCGPPETSKFDKNSLTNPVIIVEVLSPSTEASDRGEKFWLYRQLPSLQAYILIQQSRVMVEVFTRTGENVWEIRTYTELTDRIPLPSLKGEITVDEVYRGWELNHA